MKKYNRNKNLETVVVPPSIQRKYVYRFAMAADICQSIINNLLIQKAFRKLEPPQQKINKYSQINLSNINIKLTTPQISAKAVKQNISTLKDDEDQTLKLKKPKNGIRFVKKESLNNFIRSRQKQSDNQSSQSHTQILNKTDQSIATQIVKEEEQFSQFNCFENNFQIQNEKKASSSTYINPSNFLKLKTAKIQFRRQQSLNRFSNQFVNLEARIIQEQDLEDQMISKFRQRKQKFYGRNGDSTDMSKRQLVNHPQSNKNQNYAKLQKNTGLIPFDYTGEILPPIKHDNLKLAPHYQQMECSITQIVEPVKKKQRMGKMYRTAINLKVLDPQTYMFSSGKHDSLIFKQGIQMKQNASFMLKEGVQIKNKQNSSSCFFNYQTNNRNSRPNYDFLLNNAIKPSKVKYGDFIKYKKNGGRSTTKLTSKKKWVNESILEEGTISKKSISLKNKSKQENSKIVKGQNRKALDFLIKDQNQNQDVIKSFQKSPSILNGYSQSLKNELLQITHQKPKKKVRIQ